MLKLAELQLKLSTNEKIRLLISNQIELWEKKLDNYHIDFFRKRCYLSSLDERDNLPDFKDLLSRISPSTKMILFDLDIFIPCGIYACIISRRRLNRQKSKSIESISLIQIDVTVIFNSNSHKVSINKTATVGELLKILMNKLDLISDDYFLYFYSITKDGFIPDENEIINNLV